MSSFPHIQFDKSSMEPRLFCAHTHTHQPRVFVGTGYLTKVRGGQRTTFIPGQCMQQPNEVNNPFLLLGPPATPPRYPPCRISLYAILTARPFPGCLFPLPPLFSVLGEDCAFIPKALQHHLLHSLQLCDSPSSGREVRSLSMPS